MLRLSTAYCYVIYFMYVQIVKQTQLAKVMQVISYLFVGSKVEDDMESEGSTEDIDSTFSTFVDDMADVLKHENLDKLQRKCLENVNLQTGRGLKLSEDVEQQIEDTNNIDQLFKVMCHHRSNWNWMNIRILERMAGNCLPAKQLIKKYKKDVFSRKVKDVIPEISNLEKPPDKYYTEVKEKFEKDFDDLLIGDIVQRWNEIEKKLNVGETMLFKSITAGCIEICWLLPMDLVNHAIHSATSGHPVSQSATQKQVEGDHKLVTQAPLSATQELYAEILYLKIGEVVIKDDITGR